MVALAIRGGNTMRYEGKRVLVTGAGGFIGSHLVETLAVAGAKVTAFVHYNSRNDHGNLSYVDAEIRNSTDIVFGDIRDPFMVKKVVQSQEIVFHLAALIGIPYSYHAPQSYVETNTLGTLNVLQGALETGVARVVHTSTSEVYGTAQYVPIDEKHPLQPQSPYAASKVGADSLAWSYFLSFGLPVSTIRPFNTFGPRQSARAVIPTILSQLTRRVETIRVGSLEPIRDFTYVKDLTQAFLAVAESDGAVGSVINVGSGTGVTIAELLDRCCAVSGYRPEIVVDEQRLRPESSEVMRLVCDNSRAATVVGWQPTRTLDEGLASTLQFVEEHPHALHSTGYTI
jgi:NAD dependent epimerase/dehydratase